MLTVDSEPFRAVLAAAAPAGLIGGLAARRALAAMVIVEIVPGILIGPEVLGPAAAVAAATSGGTAMRATTGTDAPMPVFKG